MSPAPKGLAFSAVATGRNSLYLVGGRESLYKTSQVSSFLYFKAYLVLTKRLHKGIKSLPQTLIFQSLYF